PPTRLRRRPRATRKRTHPKPEPRAGRGPHGPRPLLDPHCETFHERASRPGRGRMTRTSMSRISEPTVRRLSHYYRVLEEVAAEGKRMISSHLLAEREGITSAQVRKDLSAFGSFGRRGLGYRVEHLRDEIRALLGLDRRWRACVVGAGHIGTALLGYRGFAEQGFDIVAAFDADPDRVGRTIDGLT